MEKKGAELGPFYSVFVFKAQCSMAQMIILLVSNLKNILFVFVFDLNFEKVSFSELGRDEPLNCTTRQAILLFL